MTGNDDVLSTFESADELVLVLEREGRPTVEVPVWVVRVGGAVYLRSQDGTGSGWYRRAELQPEQNAELEGTRMPVRLVPAPAEQEQAVSDAYLAKYGGPGFPRILLLPDAVAATLRVEPR